MLLSIMLSQSELKKPKYILHIAFWTIDHVAFFKSLTWYWFTCSKYMPPYIFSEKQFYFCLGFLSGALTILRIAEDKKEPSLYLPTTPSHSRTLKHFPAVFNWDNCLVLLIATRVGIALLLDENYSPLCISIPKQNLVKTPNKIYVTFEMHNNQ